MIENKAIAAATVRSGTGPAPPNANTEAIP